MTDRQILNITPTRILLWAIASMFLAGVVYGILVAAVPSMDEVSDLLIPCIIYIILLLIITYKTRCFTSNRELFWLNSDSFLENSNGKSISPISGLLLFVGFFCISYGSFIIFWLLSSIMLPDLATELENIRVIAPSGSNHQLIGNLSSFATLVLLAPIVEEILFRGILFNYWSAKFGITKGLLFSSALFAALHYHAIGLFVFALIACELYVKTRSLRLPVLFHMLNNLTVFCFAMTEGHYSFSSSSVLVLVALSLILIPLPFIFEFIKNHWPAPETKSPLASHFAEVISSQKRSRLIAATLSLICPGVGQLYNSQPRKALLVFGASIATWFAATRLLSNFEGLLCFLLLLSAVYLLTLIDAVIQARRERPLEKHAYNSWYVYLFIIGVFISTQANSKALLGYEAFRIPADSMKPTLLNGDYLIASRKHYKDNPVERGDIIIFHLSNEPTISSNTNLVKRVIGLPGESIEVRGTEVLINGKALNENYTAWFDGGRSDFPNTKIPAGHVFILGDNRDHSKDSRFFENPFIPIEHIKAKALYVYWDDDTGNRIGVDLTTAHPSTHPN